MSMLFLIDILCFMGIYLGGLCIYVHLGVVKVIMYVARKNFLG